MASQPSAVSSSKFVLPSVDLKGCDYLTGVKLNKFAESINNYNACIERASIIEQPGFKAEMSNHRWKSFGYFLLTAGLLAAITAGSIYAFQAVTDTSARVGLGFGIFMGTMIVGLIVAYPVYDHLHSHLANRYLGPFSLLTSPFHLAWDLMTYDEASERARNIEEMELHKKEIEKAWTEINATTLITNLDLEITDLQATITQLQSISQEQQLLSLRNHQTLDSSRAELIQRTALRETLSSLQGSYAEHFPQPLYPSLSNFHLSCQS